MVKLQARLCLLSVTGDKEVTVQVFACMVECLANLSCTAIAIVHIALCVLIPKTSLRIYVLVIPRLANISSCRYHGNDVYV